MRKADPEGLMPFVGLDRQALTFTRSDGVR